MVKIPCTQTKNILNVLNSEMEWSFPFVLGSSCHFSKQTSVLWAGCSFQHWQLLNCPVTFLSLWNSTIHDHDHGCPPLHHTSPVFFQFAFQVHVVLFFCEFKHLARKQHICVLHDSTRIPRNQNPIGNYYIAFRYKTLYAKIFVLYTSWDTKLLLC
jgi:hypothetical protein